jgi:AcrR family transcriptional regulator
MPRPRFSRLDPGRQREILEHAAREFAAHGYEHASLNQIIEALALNKGVFYYYFDGKADLFGAVLEMIWDSFFPSGAYDVETLDGSTFWPSLEKWLRDNHARFRREPWLAGLVRMISDPPKEARADAAIAQLLARGHAWAETLVRRGQEVGAVRTDVPSQLLLDVLTGADQAADRWLLANWDRFSEDERERVSFLIFDLWRRIAVPATAPAV